MRTEKNTGSTSEAVPRQGGRWSRERRLEFIDYRLRWEGRLNRSDLIDFFGISVPQASLDIAKYAELAPNNLRYDRSGRVYLTGEAFAPVFETGNPKRYLNDLIASTLGLVPPETSFMGWSPNVALTPSPGRVIPVDSLVLLLRAMRQQQMVVVTYQSMSQAEPTERVLSPHALAHDGFRWHIRAYCHSRKDFRDFLVARMLAVRSGASSDVSVEADTQWSTVVKLVLTPNPELSASRRRVIEMDYGMTSGEAVLECRQALLFYLLKQLGFDGRNSSSPEAQQVVLKNAAEVAQYRGGTANGV